MQTNKWETKRTSDGVKKTHLSTEYCEGIRQHGVILIIRII